MADNDKQKNSDSRSTFGTQVSKLNFFKTSKIFPYSLPSLGLVLQDLIQAFENEGFKTKPQESKGGVWKIDVYKGHKAWSALGMRPGLHIKLEEKEEGIFVEAGVGVLKGTSQVMVLHKQQGLDNFAVDIVEISVKARGKHLETVNR